jgi:hypothetical protein
MCDHCEVEEERRSDFLRKRREWYRARRQKLIDLNILPERKPGRPRLRTPEEAQLVAKQQRRESRLRTMEQIRQGLAKLHPEATPTSTVEA